MACCIVLQNGFESVWINNSGCTVVVKIDCPSISKIEPKIKPVLRHLAQMVSESHPAIRPGGFIGRVITVAAAIWKRDHHEIDPIATPWPAVGGIVISHNRTPIP